MVTCGNVLCSRKVSKKINRECFVRMVKFLQSTECNGDCKEIGHSVKDFADMSKDFVEQGE